MARDLVRVAYHSMCLVTAIRHAKKQFERNGGISGGYGLNEHLAKIKFHTQGIQEMLGDVRLDRLHFTKKSFPVRDTEKAIDRFEWALDSAIAFMGVVSSELNNPPSSTNLHGYERALEVLSEFFDFTEGDRVQ